jgi:parvulin-like peptidyl-prolyl isomerase
MQLAETPVSKKANITYQIGTIYLDEVHDYEKALAAFLKVELLDPKGSLVKDARKYQVECLERLGRSRDAQEKLEQITSLKKKPEKGETVVAEIGERVITDRDLQKRLDQLPSYAREQFSTPEQRKDFLKQFIASELMYDTAKRKGLDRNPAIAEQIFEAQKAIMVQALLKDEIESQIKIDESDLQLYFKANSEKYRVQERRHVYHIQCETREDANRVAERIKKGESFEKVARVESMDTATSGKGGDLGYVTPGGYVPGLGQVPRFLDVCFRLKAGDLSDPVETEKGFHIILVTDIQPARDPEFEEVRKRVENDMNRMKQEEFYKQLIDRMLQAENVKIYDDKLEGIME